MLSSVKLLVKVFILFSRNAQASREEALMTMVNVKFSSLRKPAKQAFNDARDVGRKRGMDVVVDINAGMYLEDASSKSQVSLPGGNLQ